MIELQHTTFIIPIKIEHTSRYENAQITLRYINKHLNTNVYILEVSEDAKSKIDFLSELNNLNIKHWVGVCDGTFHRTKYLNQMLNEVKTPVVANYDIDVLFEPLTYYKCQERIRSGKADVLYPFQWGMHQKQVLQGYGREGFMSSMDLSLIEKDYICFNQSEHGHCVFFNTDVYRAGGGENENFISWGPEDKERGERFKTLGYNVEWLSGSYVHHFEHERGPDSNEHNEHYKDNWNLYGILKELPAEELKEYYNNQQYTKQYDNFLHTK